MAVCCPNAASGTSDRATTAHAASSRVIATYRWYATRDPEYGGRRPGRYTITPREVVPALFASLRERHGSVRDYLLSVGVTEEHVDSMRAHLLE
jgi:hypothetical protein